MRKISKVNKIMKFKMLMIMILQVTRFLLKLQQVTHIVRIHHSTAKDHLVDQIVGDISKGVQIRSYIASFCEHFSFLSCIGTNRVDEALLDVD
jgi:hypothetical protein